ncbi:MAG TPA: hypothetical protein VGG34_07680 [Opitutaceae bacterium]|jgi:hypothetical protein
MKLAQIALLAAACGLVPTAAHAGLDIGINIGGPVVVRSSPPPPRHEYMPPRPGPGYVWIGGHWGWHHERWEWNGGRWDYHPGGAWTAGHWEPRGGGYVWIEGSYGAAPAPAAVAYEGEVANSAPPPPEYEAVPVAPGPDFFWIGGHWHWEGRWVWIHGRYQRHPHFHPGASWEAGRWDHRDGRWVWHDGHWR